MTLRTTSWPAEAPEGTTGAHAVDAVAHRQGLDTSARTRSADRGTPCRWVSLMYHEIVANARVNHDHWAVVASSFASQLDWLLDNGLTGETMEHCIANPDARQVAITFDDGYIGQYEHAFRLLAERGMRATFFVTTDWVGTQGFVSWDGLREMARGGMSIQSHTVSHPFLSTLGPEQLRVELTESKRKLERELGCEALSLALPGGDFPRQHLSRLVEAAGYRYVATSRPGVNSSDLDRHGPAFVDRLTVRAGQPFVKFVRQVRMDSVLLTRCKVKYQALDLARSVLGRQRYHQWRERLELSLPSVVRHLGA